MENKTELFYACCPNCKNILIQAHIIVIGYILCHKCAKKIHIEIQNGKVTTFIEKN